MSSESGSQAQQLEEAGLLSGAYNDAEESNTHTPAVPPAKQEAKTNGVELTVLEPQVLGGGLFNVLENAVINSGGSFNLQDDAQAAKLLRLLLPFLAQSSRSLTMLISVLPDVSAEVEKQVATLTEDFKGLAKSAENQSRILIEIIEFATVLEVQDEQCTMEDFTDLFETTITNIAEQFVYLSKMSISMIYTMDKAIANLDDVESFITAVHKINKQTNLLSLNATIEANKAGEMGKSFNVVAEEVRKVSRDVAELADDMRDKITIITNSINECYALLQDVAQTDLSENLDAKEKTSLLAQSLAARNDKFRDILLESAKESQKIAEKISGVVIGLQFQDRLSQTIGDAITLLQDMADTMVTLEQQLPQEYRDSAEALGLRKEVREHMLAEVKLGKMRKSLQQTYVMMGDCTADETGLGSSQAGAGEAGSAASVDDDEIELF